MGAPTSNNNLPIGAEQLSSEEEGEIIEVDSDVDLISSSDESHSGAHPEARHGRRSAEFEDISSDEELKLRQRIEELEARNSELEKIASITKTAPTLESTSSTAVADGYVLRNDFIDLVNDDDDDDNKNDYNHSPIRHKSTRKAQPHRSERQRQHHRQQQQPEPQPQPQRHQVHSRPFIGSRRRASNDELHRHQHSHPATNRHQAEQPPKQQQPSYHHPPTSATTRSRRISPAYAADQPANTDYQRSAAHRPPTKRIRQPDTTFRRPTDAEPRLKSSSRHQPSRQHSPSPPLASRRPHRYAEDKTRETARSARSFNQFHSAGERRERLRPSRPVGRSNQRSRARIAQLGSHRSRSASTSSGSSSSSARSDASARSSTPADPYDRASLLRALKRDAPTTPETTSSLRRKLRGIHDTVVEYMSADVQEIVDDTEVKTSYEIIDLLKTLTEEKLIRVGSEADGAETTDATVEECPEQVARITKDTEARKSMPEKSSEANRTAKCDLDTRLAETISLEEQELRLAALKSAILKKHEARKKRKVLEARPYSPTDDDIVLDSLGPQPPANANKTAQPQQPHLTTLLLDPLDAEFAENMEISPAMSPMAANAAGDLNDAEVADWLGDRILQPVDMELSDGSLSPEYPMDEENSRTPDPTWIPIAATGETATHATNDAAFAQFGHQESPPPPPPLDKQVLAAAKQQKRGETDLSGGGADVDEEEIALRALLLSTRARKKRPADNAVDSAAKPLQPMLPNVDNLPDIQRTATDKLDISTAAAAAADDVDYLRNLAMQSMAMAGVPQRKRTAVAGAAAAVTNSDSDISQKENKAATSNDAPEVLVSQASQLSPTVQILADTKRQPAALCSSNQTAAPPANCQTVAIKMPADTQQTPATVSPPATSTGATIPNSSQQTTAATIAAKAAIALKRRAIATANQARRLITQIPMKRVRPLIIHLSAQTSSGSDSDEWAAAKQPASYTSTLDRLYASPVLSPAVIGASRDCGAASPVGQTTTSAGGKISPLSDAAVANGNSRTPDPLSFEEKLNVYLRSVRSQNQTAIATDVERSGSSVAATAGNEAPQPVKPRKMMVTTQNGPATPLVVRHLPLATQLEYKQLVERINIMEQQRAKQQAKSTQNRTRKQPPTKAPPTDISAANQKVVDHSAASTGSAQPQQIENSKPTSAAEASVETGPVRSDDAIVNTACDNIQECATLQEPNTPSESTAIQSAAANDVEPAPSEETQSPEEIAAETAAAEAAATAAEAAAAVAAAARQLQSAERDYNQKTASLQLALQRQNKRLAQAVRVRTKELLLDLERQRIAAQLQRIEQDLAAESAKYRQLCPPIVAAQREMRATRLQCDQLAVQCRQFGQEVADSRGDAVKYTIPNDTRAQIDQSFVVVNKQTKRLVQMRRTEAAAAKRPASQSATKAVGLELRQTVADVAETGVVPQKAAAAQAEAAAVQSSSHDEPESKEEQSTGYVQQEQTTASEVNGAMKEPVSDIGRMPKYVSPLEYIERSSSTVNPDIVLCPFELQGQCGDSDCVYQHLSKAAGSVQTKVSS